MKGILTVDQDMITDGTWFHVALGNWRLGQPCAVSVETRPSKNRYLSGAVNTMLDNNGMYKKGDYAVIHARPDSIEMAGETFYALEKRGVEAIVIYDLRGLGYEVDKFLRCVCGDDLKDASSKIGAVTDAYKHVLDPIRRNGNGHWIVTFTPERDNDKEYVPAISAYNKAALKGMAEVGEFRRDDDGRIKSHDIWMAPTDLDVDRLNTGLVGKPWTFDEWQDVVFRAMAVPSADLEKRAMEIEGVRLMIDASKNGGIIRYRRDDGTDFRYEVTGRPIVLDKGRVGNNSLGGTTPCVTPITNQPTTEVFTAPIEDSVTGRIVYTRPERTVLGIINAPYEILFKNGEVFHVVAPDKHSERILRHYTGQEPFDQKEFTRNEAGAFALSRRIAEMSIAGFNPVTEPYVESGRLRPVTGSLLIDEKLGDHQATGANDMFRGKTPSILKDERVEHFDFVGTTNRRMELLR